MILGIQLMNLEELGLKLLELLCLVLDGLILSFALCLELLKLRFDHAL
jgi:hypothetical protein